MVAFSKTPPKRCLLNLALFITYALECEIYSDIILKSEFTYVGI